MGNFLQSLFGQEEKTKTMEKKHHTHHAIGDEFRTFKEVQAALRRAGLEGCNLVIAIDTTQSNTWQGEKTFGNKCLHSLSSTSYNPYQQVIHCIVKSLESFDEDKLVPVIRFGCSETKNSSVLPVRRDGQEICVGFEGILQAYNEMAQDIESGRILLSGPTDFAPSIE